MPDHLLIARLEMASLLGFHILFAVAGMAMPLLMAIAEHRWIRTNDRVYRDLAERWARGTGILFAVGAVSGTVLSFALGLLWPNFMRHAGPVIGMPFSLEGFAFFLEAIFLGIYLYGWDRLRPRLHWLCGVAVLGSGTLSGIFVVCANAWMNMPAGFRVEAGQFVDIDPWAAMWNPGWLLYSLHMVVAAFVTIGFAVAAIHAWMLLRHPLHPLHQRAYGIALGVALLSGLLQPLTGDWLAKQTAERQPMKLAAMEAQWDTTVRAPLRIGGWPDAARETTCCAIELPGMLSWLAYGERQAVVQGLRELPPEDRPPVVVVHLAFQLMIAMGTLLVLTAVIGLAYRGLRKAWPRAPWFLRLVIGCGVAGFVALEAGWTVTEVGRQPWIIYRIMRTADAVTPVPHLWSSFLLFLVLYALLGVIVLRLLQYHVFRTVDGMPQHGAGLGGAHG
ncbi:MAG: cytochrome ubiquinol oxidase subunit I [Deltaproteobacteria bacterium]|nr:cytochrome ubiquinol oxidase subunit I [Deltaproteobacteria bacterium]